MQELYSLKYIWIPMLGSRFQEGEEQQTLENNTLNQGPGKAISSTFNM